MEHLISVLVLLCAGHPAAAAGNTLTVSPDSQVTFLAVGHPSLLKIAGQGAHPRGALTVSGTNVAGDVSVTLNDFTTGINTRDKHMKEKYLEITKPGFDTAKLSVKTLPSSCLSAAGKCDFVGDLSLHGVTKSVKGTVVNEMKGTNPHAKVEYVIKLTDYAITIPSFAGVTVADEVTIDSDINFQ